MRLLRSIAGLVLVALAAAGGYGIGLLEGYLEPESARPLVRFLGENLLCRDVDCGFADPTGRSPVDCGAFASGDPRTMVLLALGQSNAANHGETRHAAGSGVANFHPADGRCYAARDPLLGATGEGGSPWTRLGDELLARGAFDRVLLVTIAVGGSRIQRWEPGGDLHRRIGWAARALAERGIEVSHIAWHQGEANRDDPPEEYLRAFAAVLRGLRAAGLDAPVFPALATLCRSAPHPPLRAAQADLAARHAGVQPGPDTDSLDRFAQRFDGCHFSGEGLDAHARLWAEILSAPGAERPAP